MLIDNCRPTDEVFTHKDPEGVVRHFNASALTRDIMKGLVPAETTTTDIPEDVARHVAENHGLEEGHMGDVEDSIDIPILLVEFADGKNLIIDGNHRIVLRYRKGLRDVRIVVVKEPHWGPYLVEDMPKAIEDWAIADAQENKGHL